MAVIWKLKALLTENQITPNALAGYLKGQLSKTAIYNLVQGEPPTSIHFVTLDVLIPALTELTGQTVLLSDLLEYRVDPLSDLDWRSHIGILKKEVKRDL